MANKRFIKPIKPVVDTPAIRDIETTRANQDVLWRDEYRYCLAQAKRLYPSWTLKQRQEYAANSANALFE